MNWPDLVDMARRDLLDKHAAPAILAANTELRELRERVERLEGALRASARAWHDDVCPRRNKEDFEHCEGQWCQNARKALSEVQE